MNLAFPPQVPEGTSHSLSILESHDTPPPLRQEDSLQNYVHTMSSYSGLAGVHYTGLWYSQDTAAPTFAVRLYRKAPGACAMSARPSFCKPQNLWFELSSSRSASAEEQVSKSLPGVTWLAKQLQKPSASQSLISNSSLVLLLQLHGTACFTM